MLQDKKNPVSFNSSVTVREQDSAEPQAAHFVMPLQMSRDTIIQALQDPLARIPQMLYPAFLDFHHEHSRRFLLQVNILGQVAYWCYGIADWIMLHDVGTLSIGLRSLYVAIVAGLLVYLYRYSRNIQLLDLLLPSSIIGAAIIWFELLVRSTSPDVMTFQYAAVIFIMLANLSVQVRFTPVLILSQLISAVVFFGVIRTSLGHPHAILGFALVYVPVLLFSLYISWSATLKNRQIFLRHMLEEWNHQALDQLAHTDMLTNLNNRRQFERLARSELARLQRHYEPMCLLMFDVDHFKDINDHYGHDVGDEVLKIISQTAQEEMRTQDLLARFGGEEFVALLPNTNLDEAKIAAERLRQHISESRVITSAGDVIEYTISIGICLVEPKVQDLHSLLKSADQALYLAKESGRNCIRLATQTAPLDPV